VGNSVKGLTKVQVDNIHSLSLICSTHIAGQGLSHWALGEGSEQPFDHLHPPQY